MPIPTLEFGSTGHDSTRLIFGAASLAAVSQDVADRVLDLLLQHGVNHIDVAASYGDAELRVAPWLRAHRDEFFLATKTGERTADAALRGAAPLARAARRGPRRPVAAAQPGRPDRVGHRAQPGRGDRGRGPGASEEGLVRFVGVTGHGAQIAATHRRSLERFDFDSVLLPYNWVTMQSPYYAENFDALQATCAERGVAVQTIKSIARRPWLGRAHTGRDLVRAARGPGRDSTCRLWWALGRDGVS